MGHKDGDDLWVALLIISLFCIGCGLAIWWINALLSGPTP